MAGRTREVTESKELAGFQVTKVAVRGFAPSLAAELGSEGESDAASESSVAEATGVTRRAALRLPTLVPQGFGACSSPKTSGVQF